MNRSIAILSASTVAVMLSTGAHAAGPAVSAGQIEAARTPADHEAIVAAYDKEAERLEALAKEHLAMAKSYQAAGATQKGYNAACMATHCEKLADRYAAAAKENRELAKEHRAMKEHAAQPMDEHAGHQM